MPELTLDEARRSPRPAPEPPGTDVPDEAAAETASSGLLQSPAPDRTGLQEYVQAVYDELDEYLVILKGLNSLEPDEVYAKLSAISARLTEIRSQLWRTEHRAMSALRSRHVDPLIEEVERQFKLHSRLQSVREFDLKLLKGQI